MAYFNGFAFSRDLANARGGDSYQSFAQRIRSWSGNTYSFNAPTLYFWEKMERTPGAMNFLILCRFMEKDPMGYYFEGSWQELHKKEKAARGATH